MKHQSSILPEPDHTMRGLRPDWRLVISGFLNANWAWWWEVDNVQVTACAPNQPTAIGLTDVIANPVAPLSALPYAIPAGLAALASLAWVARKRTR